MGDRVSIQFRKGKHASVTLFSHWGGQALVRRAQAYVRVLHEESRRPDFFVAGPLGRLEPATVMVDFIHTITNERFGEGRVTNDLYLGRDEYDGDNSDNGHWVIDLFGLEPDVVSGVYLDYEDPGMECPVHGATCPGAMYCRWADTGEAPEDYIEDLDDDGEEFLRKMENAADMEAAGVPLADREY